MRIAIHQPHYFPWIGYFDKMAKSDSFVLLDEVQFEKGSPMNRNRVIDSNGSIKYITISVETENFLNIPYRSLQTKNNREWKTRQINALENYYKKARFKTEAMGIIKSFFDNDYKSVCEWTINSIYLIKELLEIPTHIIHQSQIEYDRSSKKSDLILSICEALNVDTYLSGRGASVNYLNRNMYKENGIDILFQNFEHPSYIQCNSQVFISGVSIIDCLFNCGIEETNLIFWENVKKSIEREGYGSNE